ncbi:MAG: hypothetical protein IJD83_09870 [Clostridia bacterium]|nr:hypothetical protein [Clostridia bacterium]
MTYVKERFSVWVNCHLPDDTLMSDKVQDFEDLHEDYGFIFLPENYTKTGMPTRLVINCHGAGGTVTTDDSQIEHQAITQYLVANGYAVMDANGLPETYSAQHDINICNNIGSPIAVSCYVKAYHYCMKNYNLYPDVFVHGASMGGISSTNLVLSGQIPVIAQSGYCPVLDTYNQIFLHPWSGGLPKIALCKFYKLDQDENGEYIYDEAKIAGFNPAKNKKAEAYPVPVKFWHCIDDEVVSHEVTKRFVDNIRANGGEAHLRLFSYGGHQPQMVGDVLEKPCGISTLNGEKIEITPAVEETFLWIQRFE